MQGSGSAQKQKAVRERNRLLRKTKIGKRKNGPKQKGKGKREMGGEQL